MISFSSEIFFHWSDVYTPKDGQCLEVGLQGMTGFAMFVGLKDLRPRGLKRWFHQLVFCNV